MQQVDDPPYLSVGTEVSAKYKGAFCEAKVRKVVRNIKCKVAYKQGLGSGTVSDDQIKCDLLRVGATVEVKHPDRREYVEATITKIQDYSQYTVVFDDGDITTLRRSALCLKSGRHFNESETLDQLPLTHPEHFGNPVIGGRRGRSLELYKKNVVRSRHTPEDSSDEDEEPEAAKPRVIEKEEHIGKIVCVESTESKKKGPKENWFPALVVAPTAQDTVRIRVKDEYLVRSFKDGRYYTVPKKEATEFTREQATKQDTAAVQAALEYLHNDCLPAHWDREVLFGLGNSSSDFYNEFDSDTSDDEPTEEKDHFVAQLYKYMDDRGTPLNKGPSIINKDVDLYRLFRAVQKLGGYNRVTTQNQWKQIAIRLGFVPTTTSIQNLVKQAYKKFLLPFEEFDRKLGCTMVAHPRANRIKGRSLVRANSVASPKPEKESKSTTSAAEESENTSESSIDTNKPKTKTSGKVKTLIDRYEEKLDDAKQKESKEKEPKPTKESTTKVSKERDNAAQASSSKSLDVPATPSNKKDKSNKKQATPQVDEKKGKKKAKEIENEKTKTEQAEKDKNDRGNFPINVGDKLKVYYHEQKVTYEAKVIEISKQNENVLYLVHYTGWNTRYDEWVPKERIAENLTNSKTYKRSKTCGKNEVRSNSSASEKVPGPSPIIRSSVKRNRISSRGESQPPRSTTPSSVASNSSRTKSPATPAQRRTTRGQPSKLRRASNNTDISSLQTDSDSDSDQPVVKKPTPKRKVNSTKAKAKRETITETVESKKDKDSNPSSEEESLAATAAKTREFELGQMRSELKGFSEIKKAQSETAVATSASLVEKKIDYIPKTEPDATPTPPSDTNKTTSSNKTSSENSSETDSYGDEDSQFSDKTTTLENVSDKFPKFAFGKTTAPAKTELVDRMATLKPSGIEKIIKNTLAEKPKSLPEKPSMKSLVERTPLKQFEKEREREKELIREKELQKEREKEKEKEKEIENEKAETSIALDPEIEIKTEIEKVGDELDKESDKQSKVEQGTFKEKESKPSKESEKSRETDKDKLKEMDKPNEKDDAKLTANEKSDVKDEISKKPDIKSEKEQLDEPTKSKTDDTHIRLENLPHVQSPSTSQQTSSSFENPAIVSKATETAIKTESADKNAQKHLFADKAKPFNKSIIRQPIITTSKEDNSSKPTDTDAKPQSSISPVVLCDIYEFKEPEPFEFETAKKSSPEVDKKPKRKTPLADSAKASTSAATKRAKKAVKELEKIKDIKLSDDDQIPSPISSPTASASVKVESVFDSLRKSPSFNISANAANTSEGGEFLVADPLLAETPTAPPTQPEREHKPLFISSFVEASPEDTAKIFDLKISTGDSREDLDTELESVKKILLTDEVLNQEPPKIDKPSSIADKVLKALHSQQHLPSTSATDKEKASGDDAPNESTKPQDTKICAEIKSKAATELPPSTSAPSVSDKPPTPPTQATMVNKDSDSVTTKPVLSSPEHKIDILESISPKNNDLSETIQKLESVIQKSAEQSHLSEDSTDSTDSERRLIIEDESQSSETPTDFVLNKLDSDQSYSTRMQKKATKAAVESDFSAPTIPFSFQHAKDSKNNTVLKAELAPTSSPTVAVDEKPNDFNTEQLGDQPEATDTALCTKLADDIDVNKGAESVNISETVIETRDDCMDIKKEVDSCDEDAKGISLLLCEETIPGSPAPVCPKEQCDSAKKGYDNMFASPNPADVEAKAISSISLETDSMSIDNNKAKSKNATPGSSPRDSMSQDDSSEENNKKLEQDRTISPKKRPRTRKQSESEPISKRRKPLARRNTITGSDSEDNSDINATQRVQRPSKTCQYNFLVQLDPAMNSNQRISLLKKKIQDLRKTYNMIKTELASIDRRRKKLRRREREMKKNVQKQLQQQQTLLQQQQQSNVQTSTSQVNTAHQSNASAT